jgi:hypothetical protein
MRYENESETVISLRNREGKRGGELLPIVVPELETMFVLLEALHESVPVQHDVFTFVAINVHTGFLLPIFPAQNP